MSIIIGIDPGSRMTGYGIIRQTGDKLIYLDAGTIHTEAADMPERLKRIFAGLSRIVAHYQKYLPLDNQHALLENALPAATKIFPHPASMVKPQPTLTIENPLLITESPPNEPIIAAIEQVFMASNPDSALKLGQARGAAIAALVAKDLPVHEYTARQIKQAVCGYGAADKEQVQEMVVRLLNLPVMPQADAADGLACAICHAHSNHSMQKLLAGAGLRGSSTAKKKGRWRLSEADLLGK